MKFGPRQIEVIDDAMAELLRAMTGQQRLWIADRMFNIARRAIVLSIRTDHPDWGQQQINEEAARRLSRLAGKKWPTDDPCDERV